MIYKMKKLSLLVYYKDKINLLDKLTSLGVVHPDTQENVIHEDIQKISDERADYVKAIKIINDKKTRLAKQKRDVKAKENISENDLEKYVNDTLSYNGKIDKLKAEREALLKDKSILEPFGIFDIAKLKLLEESTSYKASFYSAPKKEYQAHDFSNIINIAVDSEKRVYFVVFKRVDEEIYIPFETITIPNLRLDKLNTKITDLEKEINKTEEAIVELINTIPLMKNYLSIFDEDIYYVRTRESFVKSEVTQGKVEHIKAFIPVEKENDVVDFLDKNNISYSIEKPGADDNVPIKLKNNKYSGAFKLITNLFQLPDYYELDLTPMIAVFYPIFFAFCFGDSGYGIVLTTVSLIATFTILKKNNMINIGIIGITLGILTTIMGVINSGVFFGINFVDSQNIPIFKELYKFTFITDTKGNNWFLTPFNAALLCGLLQIFIALIINIVNKVRYGTIGNIFSAVGKFIIVPSLVLWFLGDMQKMSIIADNFAPYYYYGIVIGVIFLALLSNVGQKFDVLNSILAIYFAITGLLGDILSYIRLFALGASGSILGLVVNQIGGSFRELPYIGLVLMIVFLIVGHAGNFALSILGSLVHPLRLTFVEFYNNSGFKGGGRAYQPLKKTGVA